MYITKLQKDDLVVVTLGDCKGEQPYIAKVLKIKEDGVKVQWMKGGYKGTWVGLVNG